MWKYERAKELLKKQGRTKDWLAEYCCIERTTLNHYLAGRREPLRPVLKLMAQALETTVDDLFPDLPREESAQPQAAAS